MSVVEQIRMALLFAPVSGSFFLSHFNLPIPATQIDEEAMLINHHFLVLMSAVSVLAVVVWMQEKKQVRWKSLFSSLSLYSLLFISVVYIAKPFIHMDDYYKGIYQNRKIADVITDPVQAIRIFPGETGTPRDPAKPTLQQIIETGVLKVGVEEYEAPFCYLNNSNEFAGYDIAYAYQLARDLDCSLEFVRVDLDRLSEQLLAGEFDVGMSSFVMTENRLKTIQFTQPSYQEEDNVLIIPRSRKNEFMDLNNIRALDLKILTRGVYKGIAEKYFSKATILSGQDLSLLKNREVDACFWARTSGFIWCILNPEFIVMDYGPSLGKAYIAYPFRENAFAFASFMNNWLKVKEQVGFKKKMREYWIQGLPPERRPSRWSILKDMLHLVE
jgi:ABC-type amino acid transport substrate-binding protein